ncbi:gastrula zinc finger protein XlCGF17.1-like isoform X2 [Pieris napi]|nr:gastrula zinc finger protein XlCGF17.1-like isoform X2 [Pieris napi]
MRCCRTCLGEGKEMKHIHTIIYIAGNDVRLSDILLNFYNYKVEKMLPEYICINCVYQLTITYSFKILLESSTKKLMEKMTYMESESDNNDDYFAPDEKEFSEQDIKPKIKTNNIEIEPSVDLFCVECKAMFSSSKSLYEHCMKTHPIKNTVGRACEYCCEKFEDFRSLIMHRKLHLRPFICENCWVGFYRQDDIIGHHCQPSPHKSKDNTDKKLLRQCDQCGKSYPPGYIRIHMLTHGSNRAYSCKYCPKKFKVPGSLNSHILWNHKRTRNHRCEVCNATFITSSSRSSHIRKNHLKETKYSCETCGKRFFSKSELQRHSLTHTGVKNFHCHLCDKSYQTRYGLNVHLKSHPQPVLLSL